MGVSTISSFRYQSKEAKSQGRLSLPAFSFEVLAVLVIPSPGLSEFVKHAAEKPRTQPSRQVRADEERRYEGTKNIFPSPIATDYQLADDVVYNMQIVSPPTARGENEQRSNRSNGGIQHCT